MERAAYQWNAELSVYVDRGQLRRGIGRALYQAVMEILKLQNVQTVYGIVTSPNENSERLHMAMALQSAPCSRRWATSSAGGWTWPGMKRIWADTGKIWSLLRHRPVDPETLTRIMENCAGEIAKAL